MEVSEFFRTLRQKQGFSSHSRFMHAVGDMLRARWRFPDFHVNAKRFNLFPSYGETQLGTRTTPCSGDRRRKLGRTAPAGS